MNPLRCFAAVPLDPPLRRALGAWQAQVAPGFPEVKWTHAGDLHITLQFFGDVAPARVEILKRALAAALADFGSFQADLVGLGAFPSRSRPRIIWAGVGEGADRFRDLAGRVAEASVEAGLGLESGKAGSPFHPHVTLGRLQRPTWRGLPPALTEGSNRVWGTLEITRAVLVRSRLTPTGPVYTDMERFPLDRDGAGP